MMMTTDAPSELHGSHRPIFRADYARSIDERRRKNAAAILALVQSAVDEFVVRVPEDVLDILRRHVYIVRVVCVRPSDRPTECGSDLDFDYEPAIENEHRYTFGQSTDDGHAVSINVAGVRVSKVSRRRLIGLVAHEMAHSYHFYFGLVARGEYTSIIRRCLRELRATPGDHNRLACTRSYGLKMVEAGRDHEAAADWLPCQWGFACEIEELNRSFGSV